MPLRVGASSGNRGQCCALCAHASRHALCGAFAVLYVLQWRGECLRGCTGPPCATLQTERAGNAENSIEQHARAGIRPGDVDGGQLGTRGEHPFYFLSLYITPWPFG